ncbi:MAG: hypothetical protein NTW82_09250 [Bacteroidia bacterium]|nr:hypothetical protein [Bacteroidia bacterium]
MKDKIYTSTEEVKPAPPAPPPPPPERYGSDSPEIKGIPDKPYIPPPPPATTSENQV